MKKIITAVAIAAIMSSSAAIADWDIPFFSDNDDWDIPFFSDDDDYYNDNRWNNDGYGYGRGDGNGRGRGRGRGSFNFSMDFDFDADADFDGDANNYYYGSGYNNWDNRYYANNGYYGAPYGYVPVAAPQAAPVATTAAAQ